MNRISLDSDLWCNKEYYSEVRDQIKAWSQNAPSADTLAKFIDTGCACSDYVYDVFFYALPYFLDEVEKRERKDKVQIGDALSDSIIKALTDEYPEICISQLDEQRARVLNLLFANIEFGGCRESATKSHLAALAALSSFPDMAIVRLDY